jgi:hypothetical protein
LAYPWHNAFGREFRNQFGGRFLGGLSSLEFSRFMVQIDCHGIGNVNFSFGISLAMSAVNGGTDCRVAN